MRLVILISMLLGGAIARAGGVGNGGIAVVCRAPNGEIRSAELLDYYEASVRGIPIKLGGPNLSVQDKLKIMLSRLAERGDINRSNLYRQWIGDFFSEKYTKFLRHTTLEKTNDVYNNSFPDGCGPEQLIIQQKPEFPEDRLWTVSQDIWDKMDNDNRAGAVMHEVMYREALNQKYGSIPKDSRRIRYFNSYVAGDLLSGMTEEQYINFIANEVQLGTVSAQGVEFNSTVDFFKSSNGQVIKDGSSEGAPIHYGGNVYESEYDVSFYPSGNLKQIANLEPGTSGTVRASGQTLQISVARDQESYGYSTGGRFFSNGSIEQVPIKDQLFNWNGTALSIGYYVILDEAQNLRETNLDQPATFSVNGRDIQGTPGKIKFDKKGNVTGANATTPQDFDSAYFHLKTSQAPYYFEIHSNGTLKALDYYDGRVLVDGAWHDVAAPIEGDVILTFYATGAPKLVALSDDIGFQIQNRTLSALHEFNIEYDPSGHVLAAEVARGGFFDQNRDWVKLSVNGQSIRFSRTCGANGNGCKMLFYPDGHVKAGMLYDDNVEYRNPDGKTFTIYRGVVFDDNGQVLKQDLNYY